MEKSVARTKSTSAVVSDSLQNSKEIADYVREAPSTLLGTGRRANLLAEVDEQTRRVRQVKAAGCSPALVKVEIATLRRLKQQLVPEESPTTAKHDTTNVVQSAEQTEQAAVLPLESAEMRAITASNNAGRGSDSISSSERSGSVNETPETNATPKSSTRETITTHSNPSTRTSSPTSVPASIQKLTAPVTGHVLVFDMDCNGDIPKIDASASKCSIVDERYLDAWDEHHVRLPCSPSNTYTERCESGSKKTVPRWGKICQALSKPILTVQDLIRAIQECNPTRTRKWRFDALDALLNEEYSRSERDAFLRDTLPEIVRLALALPTICPTPIPLLRQEHEAAVSLTNQQVACLLAHAFFCTLPDGENLRPRLNRINFKILFASAHNAQLAKLKCILQYFAVVATKPSIRVITCSRFNISTLQGADSRSRVLSWRDNTAVFEQNIDVRTDGFIEDCGWEYSQVDFANKV